MTTVEVETEGMSIIDPAHDLLTQEAHPLDYIFKPKNVAVIGATEKMGSVGRTVLWNLIANPFGGAVYPVNLKRPQVLGVRAYPTVADIPENVDLAVICTAAKFVPSVVEDCVKAGVKGIVIISAGFAEMGEPGHAMMDQIMKTVEGTGIRIIGPNCLGVMNPMTGINATFGSGMAHKGNVAFISQSGALCTAILDWSIKEQVGFSSFVSIGSMLDVDWGDLIDYFGKDPNTDSIVIYMESVGDAKSFLSAAKEVALQKPIIVIKAGRTEAAAAAAASHTGTMTGSDSVLEAAFNRVGVMRVDSIGELFDMSELLDMQPLPRGRKLTIVTNAGGPGVLATDALSQGEGKLTQLSEVAFKNLNEFLPAHWSRANPIDVLGDATPELYAKSLEIAAADENADAMLVILTPQDMTDPTETAKALAPYAHATGKPVLASWMGGPFVEEGRAILSKAGIPNFDHPDAACRAFNHLWKYSNNLKDIYTASDTEIASAPDKDMLAARDEVRTMIQAVLDDGRTLLNEFESKKLLSVYGIPTVRTEIAQSPEEAVKFAEDIGYPVVLKLYSNTITHKSDVGGVKLNLKSAEEVHEAYTAIHQGVLNHATEADFGGVTVQDMIKLDGYEIILGSNVDPQFGPVLLFGTGGKMVEVFKDSALALPPLTPALAKRMMAQTKIYQAFKGYRDVGAIDINKLTSLLVNFSDLISQEPWIKELDINPLLVNEDNIVALDARVLLHDPETPEDQLPKPAIRPYPIEYISKDELKSGEEITLRPIRSQDEQLIVDFHGGLSEATVFNRYQRQLSMAERVEHNRLVQVCFTDYEREMALVAFKPGNEGRKDAIIGVTRFRRSDMNPEHANFILIVTDKYQSQGLGKILMRKLLATAKAEGIEKLYCSILKKNEPAQRLIGSFGFEMKEKDENFLFAELAL